jgi:hypothetical protein
VTAADYDALLVPAVDEKMRHPEFEGFQASGVVADLRLGIAH